MKKIVGLVFLGIVFLGSLFAFDYAAFHDRKLHVIFCDVGQGDAILMKTPNSKVILVDGGPDKKVLTCLSKHLPFWHRNIDLLLLTHPHLDHFFGMHYVLERYSVTSFATEELANDTESFQELLKELSEKGVPQRKVFAKDRYRVGNVVIRIESPSADYLHQTSPGGLVGERAEFASIVTRVMYGEFSVLLTGDSQEGGVLRAGGEEAVDVFQVPHHGSATGVSEKVLSVHKPKLAVISVGRKNRYGHPSKKVLELLKKFAVRVERTDEQGDIEIISDGKAFWVAGKH